MAKATTSKPSSFSSADIAGLLQRPHPAQTRRRGNADAAGQFHIGHAAIRLQFGKDFQINGIQSGKHWRHILASLRSKDLT
jgi:hypothetical protein